MGFDNPMYSEGSDAERPGTAGNPRYTDVAPSPPAGHSGNMDLAELQFAGVDSSWTLPRRENTLPVTWTSAPARRRNPSTFSHYGFPSSPQHTLAFPPCDRQTPVPVNTQYIVLYYTLRLQTKEGQTIGGAMASTKGQYEAGKTFGPIRSSTPQTTTPKKERSCIAAWQATHWFTVGTVRWGQRARSIAAGRPPGPAAQSSSIEPRRQPRKTAAGGSGGGLAGFWTWSLARWCA